MKKLIICALSFITTIQAFALELGSEPTVSVQIKKPESNSPHQHRKVNGVVDGIQDTAKNIKLLNLKFSSKELQAVNQRITRLAQNQQAYTTNFSSPKSKRLEVNNLPILDQGEHGSCVMFAVTTAINAATQKTGDQQISQLCQLQLGSYIASKSFYISGWDGSFADKTLEFIENYGYLTLEEQKTNGCGGEIEYPTQAMPSNSLSLEQFWERKPNQLSVFWGPIASRKNLFEEENQSERTLALVKEFIDEGIFVSTGVMLFAPYQVGVAGAGGYHQQENDTWILSPTVVRHALREGNRAGHEMLIIGYDDSACVTDEQNNQHCGLIQLQNSWGTDVGDNGYFYMSYDYFMTAVMEAHYYLDLSQLFGTP